MRKSLLFIHLFPLSTAHTVQIIYVEGLESARITAVTGLGNPLGVFFFIKGLLGEPNFELDLKNDVVMY